MRVRIIISKHGLNPVCLVLIFSLVGAGSQCDTWHWEYHCHQIWEAERRRYWLAHMIPLVSVLNGNHGEKQTMKNTKNVSSLLHLPVNHRHPALSPSHFYELEKRNCIELGGRDIFTCCWQDKRGPTSRNSLKYPVSGSPDDVPRFPPSPWPPSALLYSTDAAKCCLSLSYCFSLRWSLELAIACQFPLLSFVWLSSSLTCETLKQFFDSHDPRW